MWQYIVILTGGEHMFNFRDKKKKRVVTGVIVVILVLCMIVPMFAGMLR